MPFDDIDRRYHRDGRGSPFEPTDDQRRSVEVMCGFGMPQEKIRLAIINPHTNEPVSLPTFEKAFRHEIDSGAEKLKAETATFMVNTIFGRPPGGNAVPIVDQGVRGRLLVLFAKSRMGLDEGDRIVNNINNQVAISLDDARERNMRLVGQVSQRALPNLRDVEPEGSAK